MNQNKFFADFREDQIIEEECNTEVEEQIVEECQNTFQVINKALQKNSENGK